MEYEVEDKNENKKVSYFTVILVAIIVLMITVAGFFGYRYYESTQVKLPESGQVLDDKLALLKDKINKLMMIDTNEDAMGFVVEDPSNLQQQSGVFHDTQAGDAVLIQSNSSRVIIYRPSENRLVNVGVIVNDESDVLQSTKTTE